MCTRTRTPSSATSWTAFVRNEGRQLSAGDGYAAAAGSSHDDFATDTGAAYIVIFRI
jgi:hypothetical protein